MVQNLKVYFEIAARDEKFPYSFEYTIKRQEINKITQICI